MAEASILAAVQKSDTTENIEKRFLSNKKQIMVMQSDNNLLACLIINDTFKHKSLKILESKLEESLHAKECAML